MGQLHMKLALVRRGEEWQELPATTRRLGSGLASRGGQTFSGGFCAGLVDAGTVGSLGVQS